MDSQCLWNAKKMVYHKATINSNDFQSAIGFMKSLDSIPDGYLINFLCLESFLLEDFKTVCVQALKLADVGTQGMYYDSKSNFGVSIQKNSSSLPDKGKSSYNWEIRQKGVVSEFSLVMLENNRPQTLLNSVKAGSKQLDKDEMNVIAVQTSLKGSGAIYSINEVTFYFACLRAAISNFWDNNINSRVKGILLVQGPY